MHHPTDRIAHTKAFVTPVVEHWLEREIAQWPQFSMDAEGNGNMPGEEQRAFVTSCFSWTLPLPIMV